MFSRTLLIGISTTALAAGTAAAQSTTTTDTRGNTKVVQCAAGNTCDVFNQSSTYPENTRNFGSIFVANGTNNGVRISQDGDDNSSTVDVNGKSNASIVSNQSGDDHRSDIDITGDSNQVTVAQADQANSSTVDIVGSKNLVNTFQGYKGDPQGTNAVLDNPDTQDVNEARTASGTPAGAPTFDGGAFNRAVVTVRGDGLNSYINQGNRDGGAAPKASDNSATVNLNGPAKSTTPLGTGNSSRIDQQSRGNTALVNIFQGGFTTGELTEKNSSDITQDNDYYSVNSSTGLFQEVAPTTSNNPLSGNKADVAITGVKGQNSSRVDQNGVNNIANVSILGGGPSKTAADTGAAGQSPSGDRYATGLKQGNDSQVEQSGRGNRVDVSSGGTFAGSEGQGNASFVRQGNPLDQDSVTAGVQPNLGRDHRASVFQRGLLDRSFIYQDNAAGQFGSVADVAQSGRNATSTVFQAGTNFAQISQARNADGTGGDNNFFADQTDAGNLSADGTPGGPFGGGTDPTVVQSRNEVRVSQAGINNNGRLVQNAINANATLWQKINSRNNYAEFTQGNGAAADYFNRMGGRSDQAVTRSELTGAGSINVKASITQSGTAFDAGTAASPVARGAGSAVGTNAAPFIQPGQTFGAFIGQDGRDLSASIDQSGAGFNSHFAGVAQTGRWNSASVSQSGLDHSALVEQQGTNGTATLLNLATVQQTGGGKGAEGGSSVGHKATIRQLSTVGATASTATPSGDCGTSNANCPAAGIAGNAAFPNAREAGVRYSAEARIIQAGARSTSGVTSTLAGNSATIEQRGLGQYAEINQDGLANEAGILQGLNATNSVAIIVQTGNSNRFFITQTAAGQYLRVVQNGDGNVTSSVAGGPANAGGTTLGGETSKTVNPFAS